MDARILVVDDEPEVVRFIKTCLELEGFTVMSAEDGEAGLRAVTDLKPDLAILDLMLPRLDGLGVCRRIRRDPDTATLPVILLSGRADDLHKVIGLEAGADDFITKPCSAEELVARVRALLRRTGVPAGRRLLRAGGISMDLHRYAVQVGGQEVRLTVKEFELLRVLMEGRGRVLRRGTLLEQVWKYENETEIVSRTVDVHIRRLREKLGAEGARIVTVRGVGYRFEIPEQGARME